MADKKTPPNVKLNPTLKSLSVDGPMRYLIVVTGVVLLYKFVIHDIIVERRTAKRDEEAEYIFNFSTQTKS